MEQHDTLTGMLDLMTNPAFSVKNGMIAYANRPALACMLEENTPISQILFTGAEEYAEFQNAGYMGLYGGLTVDDIHKRKNLISKFEP